MKITPFSYWKLSLILAIIIASYQANASPASLANLTARIKGAETQGSISDLSALSKEIEMLWPKDLETYFYAYKQLEIAWEKLAETNIAAREEMAKLDQRTLAKDRPSGAYQLNAYLRTKAAIIQQEVNLDLATSNPNIAEARKLLELMGEVRSLMIPGYKRTITFMNVSPPSNRGKQSIVSGMDPNELKDPQDRADYLKAIEENRLLSETNTLQDRILPEIQNAVKVNLSNYCRALFATYPEDKQEFSNLAKLAHLTEEERTYLLK
jgi:hypothetical protein